MKTKLPLFCFLTFISSLSVAQNLAFPPYCSPAVIGNRCKIGDQPIECPVCTKMNNQQDCDKYYPNTEFKGPPAWNACIAKPPLPPRKNSKVD
jgi:hypothetical protein